MPVYRLDNRVPSVYQTAYIHPATVIIGDATVGAEASTWTYTVLR